MVVAEREMVVWTCDGGFGLKIAFNTSRFFKRLNFWFFYENLTNQLSLLECKYFTKFFSISL